MPDDRWRGLYGAADGRWLLVTGPIGDVGPPRVGDLMGLGSASDVVQKLYNRLHEIARLNGTARQPFQAQIAGIVGVSQQTVARYLAGTMEPRLSNDGYTNLVRTLFSLGESGQRLVPDVSG